MGGGGGGPNGLGGGGGLVAEGTHDAVAVDHWLFAHTIVVDEASHATAAPNVLWHVVDSAKPVVHCSVACVGLTCVKALPRTVGRGAVQPVGAVELCWQPTCGVDHCPLVHDTDVDGGGGPNGLLGEAVGAENPELHRSVAAVPPD